MGKKLKEKARRFFGSCAPKIKTFRWKLLHKSSQMFDKLSRLGLREDTNWMFCKREAETTEHLFQKCDYLVEVWKHHPMRLKGCNLYLGT